MGDTTTGVAVDAATTNATTATDGVTQTPATADADTGEGWRNPAEIKNALKELRTLRAEVTALKSGAKQAPRTEPLSDVAELRAELTLRDALADMGLSPRAKQRQIISAQYRLDGAPPDVGSWLEEMSDALGLRTSRPNVATSQAGTTITAPQATNLGAPQREERVIPRDVRQIAPTDWAAMTPLERRDRMSETMRAEGKGNPFYRPLPGAK